ncbi:MAG: UDP-N-acetylmuramate dehydrogenase [Opitutaceae bacterium]
MTVPLKIENGLRIHFVGIGGMGMAPLAMFLAESGCRVSGEDANLSPEVAQRLKAREIVIPEAGPADPAVSALVYSSAVGPDHPSLRSALDLGLPVFRRGEALAALAADRRLIAVAGSHGKTSSCAMLIHALRTAGMDPGYVLGGLFADDSIPPACRGSSDWLVAEIDESDGTIDLFSPEITLCVNLELDHCDRYADLEAIKIPFRALADRTKRAVFFNRACPVSRDLFGGRPPSSTISFGPGGDYDLLGSVEGGSGRVLSLGGRFGQTTARVRARGEFNAINACGALAVSGFLGVSPETDLLAAFPGVRRRQQILIEGPHLTVMEDYAHHPSEIGALIEAIRPAADRRLVIVFQPHRYSRTARFRTEFAQVLQRADRLYLMDVYPAAERPVDGGKIEDLLDAFRRFGDRSALPEVVVDDLAGRRRIAEDCRDGDFLLFVGAGSIDRFARGVVGTVCSLDDRMGRLTRFFRALRSDRVALESVRINEALDRKTTIRIGGPAELFAEPASVEELQVLLGAAHEAGLPVNILGRGSNLIVPDEGVAGLVVRLLHPNWGRIRRLEDGRLLVGAGLRLKELCGQACHQGWSGFEFLEGIPGTLGGALRMNAGAMGSWIYEVVDEVHLVTLNGEMRILGREALSVRYRSCDELAEAIAIGAILHPASEGESSVIRSRIEAYRDRRQEAQPKEPSAGCIFKNPDGDSAGRLIDALGLKGMRVGNAEISARHANFIINRGGATARDVIDLVRLVRDRVSRETNIVLEPEVLLYGRDWSEVLVGVRPPEAAASGGSATEDTSGVKPQ